MDKGRLNNIVGGMILGKIMSVAGGVVVGAASIGIFAMKLMQTKMIVEKRSTKSFEDTCSAVKKTVLSFKDEGWGFAFDSWSPYESLKKKNLVPAGVNKAMVYFVCNAKVAHKVISANSTAMAIMPCSWAVYEKSDGGVYVAKMNIGLMSKIFTNPMREAMQSAAEAEERMFEMILY